MKRARAVTIQSPWVHMAHNADDLGIWQLIHFGRIGIEIQVLSYRVLAGEILFRHTLIDNGNGGRVLVVRCSEEAATLERDLHRFQIVRFHVIFNRHGVVARMRRFWPADKPEKIFAIAAHGMRAPTQGNCFNSRS